MPSTTFSNFKLRIFKIHSPKYKNVHRQTKIAHRQLYNVSVPQQKLVPAKKPEPENVLASVIAAKCGFLCRCTHTCYLTVKIHNVIMYIKPLWKRCKWRRKNCDYMMHSYIFAMRAQRDITQYVVINRRSSAFLSLTFSNIFTFVVCSATVAQHAVQHWTLMWSPYSSLRNVSSRKRVT